jgi:general secretion pathway protein J
MTGVRLAGRPVPRSQRRGNTAGFTLIEMVLALVIFGMIAATVYAAFYFGHRAVASGERAADENQRMRLVEEILGRQLRSAVYYFARHDDDQVPYFLGASDAVSFVTSAPQSRGGTGLAVVTYRIEEGRLVLEERTSFTPEELYKVPADARFERAVLLEGFSSLRFQFRESLSKEDADVAWADKWDGRDDDGVPAAVRVTVEGLGYFGPQPWVREIPLLTMAAGWGNDDFQEPPEDEVEDDETGTPAAGESDNADTESGDE